MALLYCQASKQLMIARAGECSTYTALSHTRHLNAGESGQLTSAAFHRQGSLDELPLVDLLVALPLLSLRGRVVLLFDILIFFILLLVLFRLALIVVVRRLFASVFAVTVPILQGPKRILRAEVVVQTRIVVSAQQAQHETCMPGAAQSGSTCSKVTRQPADHTLVQQPVGETCARPRPIS